MWIVIALILLVSAIEYHVFVSRNIKSYLSAIGHIKDVEKVIFRYRRVNSISNQLCRCNYLKLLFLPFNLNNFFTQNDIDLILTYSKKVKSNDNWFHHYIKYEREF
jgi:hypothetical protein